MNRQVRNYVGEALEEVRINSVGGEEATKLMSSNDGNGPVSPSTAWPVMEEPAFCGLAGELVRILEPHSEADPNGMLLQLLAAFGNAVGSGNLFSRHESSARITRALETLERAGQVERMPGGGHGEQRWRRRLRVTP